MRCTLTFPVLLLSSTACIAQNEDPQEKFRIGVVASSDYCGRILYAEDTAGIGGIYNFYKNGERPGIGYTAGITASYQLTNTLSLTAGARYSMNRYRSEQLNFTDVNGVSIGDGYISYHNRFISVPIGIQFNTPADKFMGFTGGLAAVPELALGLWSRGHYNLPPEYDLDESFNKLSDTNLNRFMLSASANAGVFAYFGKIEIQVVATGKYGLLKQFTDVPINRSLWSAGLECRVLYPI